MRKGILRILRNNLTKNPMIYQIVCSDEDGRTVEVEAGAGAAGEDAAGFGQDEVGGGVAPGLDPLCKKELA